MISWTMTQENLTTLSKAHESTPRGWNVGYTVAQRACKCCAWIFKTNRTIPRDPLDQLLFRSSVMISGLVRKWGREKVISIGWRSLEVTIGCTATYSFFKEFPKNFHAQIIDVRGVAFLHSDFGEEYSRFILELRWNINSQVYHHDKHSWS